MVVFEMNTDCLLRMGTVCSLDNGVSESYEVKYTTENPIQLPTTPIAE